MTVATPAAGSGTGRSSRIRGRGAGLGPGFAAAYLGLVVLIPIAAIALKAFDDGLAGFMSAITDPQSVAALKLTFGLAFVVVAINAVMGTVIAWMLVRDDFPGK